MMPMISRVARIFAGMPLFALFLVGGLSFALTSTLLYSTMYEVPQSKSGTRIIQEGILLERPIETYLEVTAVTKDRTAIVARVESRSFGGPLNIFLRVPTQFLLSERFLIRSAEGVVTGMTEPQLLAKERLAPGMKGRAIISLSSDGSFSIVSLRIGADLPYLYNGQRADIL